MKNSVAIFKSVPFSIFGAFSKFHPRLLLSRAKREWHRPRFLETENVHSCSSCGLDNRLDPCVDGRKLIGNWSVSRSMYAVLNQADSNEIWLRRFFMVKFFIKK